MNLNNGNDVRISRQNDVVLRYENWQDLLGIYTGVLQDEIVPLATCDIIPANFGTNNVQNVVTFEKYNRVPEKVNSLAELMGNDSQTNRGRIILQQDQMLYANQDFDGYNLQQMIPHSRLSVSYRPSYNLNLPARTEDGESSTAARPFRLAPATPDQQKQTKNYKIIQVPHLSIEEISPQENDVVLPQRHEFVEREHKTVGTSSATPRDKQNFDGEIDLNKTPPQKTPKRRKHRPKVVIEGKPKRTPKPKATTPDGNSTTKRKYVRRKGIKMSTNQAGDAATEVEASNHDSKPKSCKRALNFDLENGVEKKSLRKNNEVTKVSFNLNVSCDNADWRTELNEQSGPAAMIVHQENLNDFVHPVDKISPQDSFHRAATATPASAKDHTLNIIARSLNVGNVYINQSGDWSKHGEVHNRISGGLAHLVIQANASEQNLQTRSQRLEDVVDVNEKEGSPREYSHADPTQSLNGGLAQLVIQANTSERNLQTRSKCLEDMVDVNEKQEPLREYSHIDLTQPLMGSQIWSRRVFGTSHYNVESCKLCQSRSESSKTKKVEDKVIRTSSGMPFGNTHSHRSNRSGGLPYSGSQGKSTTCINVIDEINKVTRYWNTNTPDSRDGVQKQVNIYEITDSPAPVPVKKQTAQQTSSKKTSSKDKALQQETKNLQGHGHYSKKVTGLQENKTSTVFVDYITDRMKDLRIDNNGNKTAGALVPYKADYAVVPYEAFDPIKKRRTRPKVDLDPETNRLWNLLMGKDGSENAEATDNDKHEKWEEERKVFRGRVDSFISQMHLVQGDRRFSKWKGSVVDSVIGVFLTQNVSDHLSSSAFMSLASKFPIKSATIRETCCRNRENPSIEHEVLVTFPDGTSYNHRTINEPTYDNPVNPGRIFLINNNKRRMDQGMISSQSSSESIVYKASKDIRSGSGSNSEREDQITRSNDHGPLDLFERIAAVQQYLFPETGSPSISYQQPENAYSYPSTCSWQKMTMNLKKWKSDEALLGKQSTASFTLIDFGITNGTGIEHAHDKAGLGGESSLTAQQTRSKFRPDKGQDFIDYMRGGMQENFQQESALQTDPTRSAEAFSKQLSDNAHQIENTKKVHSSNIPPGTISTPSNTRKRKAEKEKAEPFDWDTIRKEVQSKGAARRRSMDTMDSLDYEALRNADVREISEAIKERGMNNMLAERIKDFLNRLVRDHGEVDLEWLRNVQPDKVKDYLLSIRGLGLKSVECVRLLTLHHLAFPVDTNVGRIAVRLGWVPLQPLPESLQLHLLELYPVLESIQKYLWPRLCILDQETLYELHYQMITFGKVFCTKREPNCNACPLRAQCRHFASAFASARLALPSPEETRMVTSSPSRSSIRSSCVGINPLRLPPAQNQIMGSTGNCEPIIEEPATPELPAEMSEPDIEDAFYEDPDEIPVININIQEFTTNLQNIIQENMDIQEGDMSKALVALSPHLASIPVPKLKHISRLRTEHQVYELPDSHPLLKGMDGREPDDPSPYLLAIWTPGETADSVQPPESKCSSHEGGLCNNETCFSCNSTREAQAQTVRGTILIPCRTAMRGSFPLNGTYFQVNEVFADHETSMKPVDVPRSSIWNLSRWKVFFGTSVSTIFKGMSTDDIQQCFWRGFVCVRGFEQKSRAPRPLMARFHLPASKMPKKNQ